MKDLGMQTRTRWLEHAEDRRSIFFCVLFLLSAAVGYALDFQVPTPVWILHIAVSCTLCFIVGTIAHNSMHHPIFLKPEHNQLFQIFLSICYGHPVSVYVSGHNFSHHRNTQTRRDVIRTYKARFRWHLLNQLFFFFLVIPSLIRAENQFKARMKDEIPGWYKQFCREQYTGYLVQALLLILNWKAFFAFIWLPQLYCVWGIIGMNVIQHDGCDPDHEYNHTRSMTGPWVNWLTFNNGYHGAHHAKPHMHWTGYPAYHNAEVRPHLHPALDQKNFITYLLKTYIYPGKRLRYDGAPIELPPVGEDEDWIPPPGEVALAGTSLGSFPTVDLAIHRPAEAVV
ncbi:MAG: fatty acid desaturase [Bdellovibrionales bacterium]|nr:fatty acid desaturase [Bdellovibrionales bacterium]